MAVLRYTPLSDLPPSFAHGIDLPPSPWVIADNSTAAVCQEIYLPVSEQAPAVSVTEFLATERERVRLIHADAAARIGDHRISGAFSFDGEKLVEILGRVRAFESLVR